MADIDWKEPLGAGYYPLESNQIAAIVTFLEMTAAPAPAAAKRRAVTFQRLGAADAATYRSLYRAIGTDWGWFSRLSWTDESLAAHCAAPGVEAYCVQDDQSAPIGLVELDARAADETELAFFGVMAHGIGQGFAASMMDFAIARAFDRSIARFFVHTCTLDHPGALRFYEKSGFRAYRRAIEIADDPRVAGLLPRNAFPHFPRVMEAQA